MPTPEITFLKKLLEKIIRSKTITDEQKKEYIQRLRDEGYTQELKKELDTLFANEVQRLEEEIAETTENLKEQEELYEKEWERIQPEMKKLAKEQKEKTDQVVADFKRACDEANKKAEATVEEAMQENEDDEVDAIRESLKKEDS
tara:strand:- start:56 stop:490 length:435 start_codon:yes stop_codon:yes gene_type:complete